MSFKSSLNSMNLARWIIVIGGVGSIALGVTGWLLHQKRVVMEASLVPGGEVERLIASIQLKGKECSKLQDIAERSGLTKQKDAMSYIRDLAANPGVQIGQTFVGPLTPATPAKGVTDIKYQIKPQDAAKSFRRDNITNFMWKMEADSGRLRVTNLRIWQEQKLKEWEVGNDLWKYEAEVTSRQKDDVVPPKEKAKG